MLVKTYEGNWGKRAPAELIQPGQTAYTWAMPPSTNNSVPVT